MKSDKSKSVNFSNKFVSADATEALISEKLSKKAAKRARKREKKQNERMNIPEQEWRRISLSNPPPIPTKKEEDNLIMTTNNNKKKRKRTNAVQENNSNKDNFVDLNSLEWSEVTCPDSVFMGDDLGGFLCLEEVDYVDV